MSAKPSEIFHIDRVDTPIGIALLVTDADECLLALDWADYELRMRTLLRRQYGETTLVDASAPEEIKNSLSEYFEGDVARLQTIQCRFGGTPFQRRVWTALRAIPFGTVSTYSALAAQIGSPAAVRAVGHANGANPISVVVPCHRVIGADGSLTGYGGGLHRKHWLLTHEGVALKQ